MKQNIRAIQKTYLNTAERTTFTLWHPQVRHEGKWCFLPALPEVTGTNKLRIMDAPDELTALEQALNAYRRIEGGKTL